MIQPFPFKELNLDDGFRHQREKAHLSYRTLLSHQTPFYVSGKQFYLHFLHLRIVSSYCAETV